MALVAKMGRQDAQAFTRPTQRTFGIAPGDGFDQTFQVGEQGGVCLGRRFTSSAGAADRSWQKTNRRVAFLWERLYLGAVLSQFLDPAGNGAPGNARCLRDGGNSAMSQGLGFGGSEEATCSLVQERSEFFKAL